MVLYYKYNASLLWILWLIVFASSPPPWQTQHRCHCTKFICIVRSFDRLASSRHGAAACRCRVGLNYCTIHFIDSVWGPLVQCGVVCVQAHHTTAPRSGALAHSSEHTRSIVRRLSANKSVTPLFVLHGAWLETCLFGNEPLFVDPVVDPNSLFQYMRSSLCVCDC